MSSIFTITHTDLNYTSFPSLQEILNLATNLFVGSLEEDMFDLLRELQYFNISQNMFTGVLPSLFYDDYYYIDIDSHGNSYTITLPPKITHFDVHDNSFEKTIPIEFGDLSDLQHLNLQGVFMLCHFLIQYP